MSLALSSLLPQVLGVSVDPWGKRSLGKGSVSPNFCPVVEKMLDVHPRRVTHAPRYAESFLTKTLAGLLLAGTTRNIQESGIVGECRQTQHQKHNGGSRHAAILLQSIF